jgi:ribonuclease HI
MAEEISDSAVRIYTDGGSVPNPGRGAWAALLISRGTARYLSGYDPKTTNNKMELSAAIHALRALKKDTEVFMTTDSQYVKDGIEKWLAGWKKKNWLTSQKEPVKNKDLWLELDREVQNHEIRWGWVRAHRNDRYNNFVDWLVQDAINNERGVDERAPVDQLDKYIGTLKLRIGR